MRTITLTITALFIVAICSAQSEIDDLSLKLVDIFENTKAIKELTSNKKVVLGQLEDIKLWRKQGVVAAQSEELERAYSDYAGIMNTIIYNIETDLREISSYRELKGVRLDRFIKKFDSRYREDMLSAFTIYTTNFLPLFETASEASQSKAGIIGSILLILEFGDTIFNAVKSLFSNGDASNKSKDMLIGLAMNLVSKNLTKQLIYPTWQDFGFSAESNTASETLAMNFTSAKKSQSSDTPTSFNSTSQNRNYTPIGSGKLDKSISMTWYNSESTILLTEISKGIVVGNATNDANTMKLFATAEPMTVGDKFWVTLQGNQHTQFYYFDEYLQQWQDPFGKGIIVGGETNKTTETVAINLPSDSSYFEITDTTAQEHFLILVSDKKISEEIQLAIAAENKLGISFLETLENSFPIQYPVLTEENKLELQNTESGIGTNIYAIYITIDKSNSQ